MLLSCLYSPPNVPQNHRTRYTSFIGLVIAGKMSPNWFDPFNIYWLRFYLGLSSQFPSGDVVSVSCQLGSACDPNLGGEQWLQKIGIATLDGRDLDHRSIFDPRHMVQTRQSTFGDHKVYVRRRARNLSYDAEEFPKHSRENVLDFLSGSLRISDAESPQRLRNIVPVGHGLRHTTKLLESKLGASWNRSGAPIVGNCNIAQFAR